MSIWPREAKKLLGDRPGWKDWGAVPGPGWFWAPKPMGDWGVYIWPMSFLTLKEFAHECSTDHAAVHYGGCD